MAIPTGLLVPDKNFTVLAYCSSLYTAIDSGSLAVEQGREEMGTFWPGTPQQSKRRIVKGIEILLTRDSPAINNERKREKKQKKPVKPEETRKTRGSP